MAVERLQKIISNAGRASRRTAEQLILDGRVAVNGEVLRTLGARADPSSDEITVDGVPVSIDRYRYFMLNKPQGVVTTAHDERERETVLDLVPIGDVALHPVGRLDTDSEGLVLITNDGHLTHLLTHPKFEVEKEYLVGLEGMPSQADLKRAVRGVVVDGERLRCASLRAAAVPEPGPLDEAPPAAAAWLLVTMREGKNRELRRLFAALGRRVLHLRRVRVGQLALGPLGSGAFRELTEAEVQALYASARPRAEQPDAVAAARAITTAAPPPGGSAGPPGPARGS